MAKAIRKGTSKFDEILAGAKNVHVFALDNGFTAERLDCNQARECTALLKRVSSRNKNSKLRSGSTQKDRWNYTLRVHSNLWYSFD